MNFFRVNSKKFFASLFKLKESSKKLRLKRFCYEIPNILYKKEKILGYEIIPEEIYKLLVSKKFK